ncbi:iron uptake porin [Nostoc sp. 'Lobaria pulmonaria (5183) cyanobiont']|uniref:iron uptake porin n=1 Tax=Nostoc sp. 'Lobaria pulmonaria (5183) cyanobiont' TaxID=1618022 RepID=UPI000CF30231|nr:iron uptake porin [Nostoc sp. 'Lobaria pulmonaria (5183) cyanobiont']AVH73169.1 carbohydrate-selective porin OprB [Nostoc sp. 'Lobaria pulmonaria (5183) cyanobiont']
MSHLLWKTLVLSPVVLGVTVLVSAKAMAAEVASYSEHIKPKAAQTEARTAANASIFIQTEQPKVNQQLVAQKTDENKVLEEVNRYSSEGKNQNSLSQVTSVSQFSDVQPTDWAFQALQSLVERYGCIAGYPNSTYRGNRALTRYEFAAGLNACLDRVNELIATATADLVTKQDLATLQRLQEEFSAELATLRGRVDSLEARTAELEANQFSTTTKLVGEAIFAVSDIFGNNTGGANNTVFQDRVRLDLQTSFTGKDLLHTRLAAGNALAFNQVDNAGLPIDTAEGTQSFQIGSTGNNGVIIDWLAYYVPIGPVQAYFAGTGGIHSDYVPTNNPYFEDFDGGNGALSTFASESPIYRIGGGAGAALTLPLGSGSSFFKPSLTIGYLASNANNPGPNQGLLEGNYAALGQLNFSVGDRFSIGATYVHGYHGAGGGNLFDFGGGLGSTNRVVGTNQANTLSTLNASSSNSYGISAAFKPSDKLSVSGFISYHDVTGFGAGDDYEAWSYGLGVALPDLGKKGNVLGIFAGAEPYARNRGGAFAGTGNDIPYHFEGFYKYRVSDNVSITPGVIWLTSPGQNSNNDDAIIGTLRTTFTF